LYRELSAASLKGTEKHLQVLKLDNNPLTSVQDGTFSNHSRLWHLALDNTHLGSANVGQRRRREAETNNLSRNFGSANVGQRLRREAETNNLSRNPSQERTRFLFSKGKAEITLSRTPDQRPSRLLFSKGHERRTTRRHRRNAGKNAQIVIADKLTTTTITRKETISTGTTKIFSSSTIPPITPQGTRAGSALASHLPKQNVDKNKNAAKTKTDRQTQATMEISSSVKSTAASGHSKSEKEEIATTTIPLNPTVSKKIDKDASREKGVHGQQHKNSVETVFTNQANQNRGRSMATEENVKTVTEGIKTAKNHAGKDAISAKNHAGKVAISASKEGKTKSKESTEKHSSTTPTPLKETSSTLTRTATLQYQANIKDKTSGSAPEKMPSSQASGQEKKGVGHMHQNLHQKPLVERSLRGEKPLASRSAELIFAGIQSSVHNASSTSNSSLSVNTFQGLGRTLTKLSLSGSNLVARDLLAVSELYKLEDMDVSQNQITSVPKGVFRRLHRLKKVDLSRNGLDSLQDDAFKGLEASLESVDLQGNGLKTVSYCIFQR
jgi:hypothetical protein